MIVKIKSFYFKNHFISYSLLHLILIDVSLFSIIIEFNVINLIHVFVYHVTLKYFLGFFNYLKFVYY